ncbi:MAG: DUF721 domain-containing protein [Bacteroidota bacterium]
MSKHNEKNIKQAIEELLETYKLKGRINEVRLVNSWERIMGKSISSHTREIHIANRTLYIRLDSAPLRHELMFGKDKIIKLINEAVGESVIDDVVLK